MLHEDTTDKIIKAFYKVNNALGILENVCGFSMVIELCKTWS